jgi:transposase
VMREPQEIEDAEYEQILERVCAIDVARASGKVCTRVPHLSRPGKRRTRVWDVDATTNAVLELGGYLAAEGIEKVTLESTSDYWRIWFYLEAAGLDVQLASARDIRNAPGRPKTDKVDSVWQAKLTERGMLRPSFVPPAEIRQLRACTRLRTDLTRERTRHWQRLEKLLEDALLKVSAVASTLDTKSVRAMLEALIAGERDPKVLAGLARGRMKAKRAELIEALTGRFDDHHAELARMLLNQIDHLAGQIGTLTTRIEELIAVIPAAQGAGADGTTGPGAGTGPPGRDPRHQRSRRPGHPRRDWPGHDQVPDRRPPGVVGEAVPAHHPVRGKDRSGKAGKGNPYLKGVLGEIAAAAAKTDTFLGERYRRIVKRRGKLKALVAVARSILVIIWHLLADPAVRYHDLGAGYYASRTDTGRKTRNHVRQLEALGYTVTLAPAA